MDYLRYGPLTPTQRLQRAEQRKGELAAQDYDVTLTPGSSVSGRINQIVENFRRGYYVVPESALFPQEELDRKHGTLFTFLDENDLRELRTRMYTSLLPTVRIDETVVPAQAAASVFSVKDGIHYAFKYTDLASALLAYHSLRDTARYEEPEKGKFIAQYADNIEVRLYGLQRPESNQSEVFQASALRLPSRRSLEDGIAFDALEMKTYKANYTLEATRPGVKNVRGIFRVDSNTEQWDSFVRKHFRVWNGYLARNTPENARRELLRFRGIGFQDILGVLLIDDIAKQKHLEVNHPFRFLDTGLLQLAVDLYEQGVLITAGKPRKPTKGELEPMYTTALAVRGQHLVRKPEFRGQLLLTHVSGS
jgi:hypothetical protein